VQLLGLLAGAGVLVPVLIIVGIALAVLVFGLPAFIGAFISPLRTLGIVLVLAAIAWLFFARDFRTAGIIGSVGLLLLLGSNMGLLAVVSPGISAPDEVYAADASTMVFRGQFTAAVPLSRAGDYWQFPLSYGGELAQPMRDACCGAGGPQTAVQIDYIGGFADGLHKEYTIPNDGRNLYYYDAPVPPTGYVKFSQSGGAGNWCPTSYSYVVNFAPIVPVEAGSIVKYEMRFPCRTPHGIAEPDRSGSFGEVVRTVSPSEVPQIVIDRTAGLWQTFWLWLRGVFA